MPGSPEPRPQPVAHLNGSVLLADAEPIFPRIIQYQGEPLPLLKQLGFNAVWLPELPAAALREESQRLGLWLVCPPPRPAPADLPEPRRRRWENSAPNSSASWPGILGCDLIGEQLAGVKRWAEQVHAADSHQHRPLLCWPRNELRAYSRQVDLLVIDRRPLGSSLELADYGAWVRRQPRAAGHARLDHRADAAQRGPPPSTPALQPGRPLPAAVSGDQMRLMVYTAISAGSRGLIFLSRSPLNATDPDTRRRAMDLELLNLECNWSSLDRCRAVRRHRGNRPSGGPAREAGNQRQPEPAGHDWAEHRFPARQARNRRTPRLARHAPVCPESPPPCCKWVVPGWCFPSGARPCRPCATSQATTDTVTLVVPGTPEATLAYEVLLGRLEPLRKKRGTGGIKVTSG